MSTACYTDIPEGIRTAYFIVWMTTFILTSRNAHTSISQKAWWLLGEFFFSYPFVGLYLLRIEKHRVLRAIGIAMLVLPFLTIGYCLWYENRAFLAQPGISFF